MRLRAKYWIAWYLPLVVLWLAFVDTLATGEVVLGLVAAAIAATAAEMVRDQDLVRFRLQVSWLRDLRLVPWQVLRDCWTLAVALWRHLTGRPARGVFRALPFPAERPARGVFRALPFPAERDDARSAARRALVTGVVSLTPNTYVVGVEGGEGFVLVHQLVAEPGNPIPRSMLEGADG